MLLEQALLTFSLAVWLTALGVIVIYFVRTAQTQGLGTAAQRVFSERVLILLLLLAVVITLLTNAIVFIQPQQVGVVVSLLETNGIRKEPLAPGLHLIAPLVEQVYRYPIYYQTYTMSADPGEGTRRGDDSIAARTADGQAVYLDVSVIYAIDAARAVNVHIRWQNRYQEDYIRPLLRGLVRREVSQFTVDEVNSARRIDLENDLAQLIQTDFGDHGFFLNRFLLRNVTFSPEYARAVEEKQVAQQGVIRDRYRAEQIRILAEGEAAALDRLGVALAKNPDVALLRYIEKLAPSITTMLLPNNVPFILPLPTAFSRQGAVPNVITTPEPGAIMTLTPIPIIPPNATPIPTLTVTPTPTTIP